MSKMSDAAKIILAQALELPSAERALVAEQILLSLDRPDPEIDAVWAAEAEERLSAYKQGKIEATPVSEVLGKFTEE